MGTLISIIVLVLFSVAIVGFLASVTSHIPSTTNNRK